MWLFAVLIVLAMGGVALVASGKGAPMAPAYDDRPDALLPAAGPLGSEDLRRVRFSLAFRGYRMSEVDDLLDRLALEREESALERQEPAAERQEVVATSEPRPEEPPTAARGEDTVP